MRSTFMPAAVALAMLSACDGTITLEADANVEPPVQDASPAPKEAGALKLTTGEWLDEATYGFTQPIGGEREMLLTAAFQSEASPELREQSLQELVSRYLLPTAMREGHRKARLWVRKSKQALGSLSVSSNDDWAFERGDGRQWRQTAGPEIDWSIVRQTLAPNPDLSLNVAQKFIQTRWETGAYRLEMHTVAFPDLSPEMAMQSAVRLIAEITGCDREPARQPEFMSDENLRVVVVYAYPSQRQDLLDIVPFVSFDIGRVDGRWTCNRDTMFAEVAKTDWSKRKSWDDLIR